MFAISSQIKACLIVCNRAGNGIDGGGSCFVDRGKIFSRAGRKESMLIEDIDLKEKFALLKRIGGKRSI